METARDNKKADRALEILLRHLEEAKMRNPRFSLRAFAARLGVSSGALSEILKGKRPLSAAVKKKISEKLLLSPQESLEFFQNDLPERMNADDDRLTLSQDQFHLISDWWYFGLLSLLKTRNFKNQAAWMARRFGLSVDVIQEAWQRLFRLGYLEKKGTEVVAKQPSLRTTDGLLDLSIRRSHLADLALMEKSLLEVPLELRDHTSMTFVIDKEDLPKAREMIRIFEAQFMKQVARPSGDEVYKLSVALYPLTRVTGEQ